MEFLILSRFFIFILGMIGFIVGERYFSTEAYHYAITGGGLGLVVLSAIFAFIGQARAKKSGHQGEAKGWWYIIGYKVVFLVGAATYLLYAKQMGNSASPDTFIEKALLAAWLLSFMIGVFQAVGAELAFSSNGRGANAEPKRVLRSTLSWSMVGMLMGILFCFNYAVAKKDKAWDWSYLKATTPSDSTVAIVGAAAETIDVAVFYAQDNEVLPFVKDYFEFLKQRSDKITLNYFDKDMHPTKAEEFKASRNGQVIFLMGKKRERIDIGDTIKSARKTLRKLDGEVQKVALRLSQEKKRLYFTRGHGEMTWIGKQDPLRSISLLEKVLRNQNYSLKLFGVGEGSAKEIPEDAAAVIVAGPTQPFLQVEAEALEQYLLRGGKVFVLFDVSKLLTDTAEITTTDEDPLRKLVAKFGLKYNKVTLANQTNYISGTRSNADKWFLFSNTFSTHESVSKLSRNEERVALLMFRTGYFDVAEKTDKWRGYTTVRSMGETFVDTNLNFAFDKGETKKTFSLGAAASMKIDGAEGEEARILALGDANAISDALIRNRGNAIFALDSVRWLAGQSEFAGETNKEEDVKIQHTRKENAIWFNLTVGFVPLLMLGAGFVATRRKRRKGK